MSINRRTFINSGIAAGAIASSQRPLMAMLRSRLDVVPPMTDPDVKHLSEISLDAARAAGANYADVRLTHTYERSRGGLPAEKESMTFGVRALVDGYWGFASSPAWSPDEAARLGRAAVRQARANTLGQVREVMLAPVDPILASGNPSGNHWTMPVKDDPFEMNMDEIRDFFDAIVRFVSRIPGADVSATNFDFFKQDQAFGSTEGSYYTQRLYRTSGAIELKVKVGQAEARVGLDTLTPAGLGFEHIRDQPIREQILALVEETKKDLSLPLSPVDVGRFSTVLDASGVASLMNGTIGVATELDRALGFEANAGGTSYINDPRAMLGSLKVGAPLVRITANRNEPGGAATVQWDDEGVKPKPFTLVENGILTGMQTNREGAGWLRDYYEAKQTPITSYGCAYAPEAIYAPAIHCANLRIDPAEDAKTFDSLVAGIEKGIAFKKAKFDMDFQQITGMGIGQAFEISNGKRVARLPNAGIIFRTPEIWNSITDLGGAVSSQRFGTISKKGEPWQMSYHSVTSVPIAFKDLTIVDISRKA